MKFKYLFGLCCVLLVIPFRRESQAQEIVEEFVFDQRPVVDIAWSPDGHFLAVSNANGILILRIDGYDVVSSIPVVPHAIAWSVDSTQIAAYSLAENAILIFDVQTTQLAYRVEGIDEIDEFDGFIFVNNLVWNDCGLFSINGSIDLFLWGDSEYFRDTVRLSGHADVVINAMISDDCRYVVTSATDGTIKVWSIASGNPLLSFGVRRAFTLQNEAITYVSTEKALVERAISQEDTQVLYTLGQDERVFSLDWSGDGDYLAYTTVLGGLTILKPDSDTPVLATLSSGDRLFNEVLWHPTRPLLATIEEFRVLRVWNLDEIVKK